MYARALRAWKGLSVPGDPAWFAGPVRQHDLTQGETEFQIYAVFFPAGARTRLHRHATDQLLHVLEGECALGIGKERRLVGAEELIVVPKGVWHWHGATPLAEMCHLSIKPHADTDWTGAPAGDQVEYDAYGDWERWAAGARR